MKDDRAWVAGELIRREALVMNLDACFPTLHLQWDDLEIIDGEWTIDGMEPLEWCLAMTMD